jgi:hypothetical protein
VIYQSIFITTNRSDSAAAAATSNGAYFQKIKFDNPNDYVPLVIFQRYRIEV